MKKIFLFVFLSGMFVGVFSANRSIGYGQLPNGSRSIGYDGWDGGVDTGGDTSCTSWLGTPDTVDIRTDGISDSVTLECDTGSIIYQVADDDTVLLYSDTILNKQSPYLATDTTDAQSPSTYLLRRFLFYDTTGTIQDSTAWIRHATADSTVVFEWFYEPDSATVTINITGSGTADGDGYYQLGDTSFIVLHPSENWHCVSDSLDTIVVTADTTYQVIFGIDTFSVAAVSDVGAAITFPDDSIGGYGDTIVAVLTVAADSLANWEGGNNITPGTDTLRVYLTADTTLTAVSRQRPKYDIDTTGRWGSNISSWTIDSVSTIDSGTIVHTAVVCEACSAFAGYTGDYTGSSASGSFSLDSNMAIGASCEYGTCSSDEIERRKNPFKIWRSFRVW